MKTSTTIIVFHGSDNITADDFVEVYPPLPGQIDLLMEITSQIRTQSDKAQGDAQAIRGPMQMLGELFPEINNSIFSNENLGVNFIDQFRSICRNLPYPPKPKVPCREFFQTTKTNHSVSTSDRAVALLSMINEQKSTTAEFSIFSMFCTTTASLGDQTDDITKVLKELSEANVLGHSPKLGYSIHSTSCTRVAKRKR